MIKVTDMGNQIGVAMEGNAKTLAVELAAVFNALIDRCGEENGPLLIGIALKMSEAGQIADKWIAELENEDEDDDNVVSIDDLILAAMKEARGE